MGWRDMAWLGVTVLAGAGGWLLFADGSYGGIDGGLPGTVLLIAAAWLSLWIGAARQQRASGEWTAWVGLLLSVIAVVYFVLNWRLLLLGGMSGHARWVLVNLMLLLLGWTVLLQGWAGHWMGAVPADPSIRPWTLRHVHPHGADIERQASESGRMALTFGLICLALMLGFLPEARLHWVRPFLLAHLLLFVVMWSWLVEYVQTVWLYRRYRPLPVLDVAPPT